jgi:EpsD family peptidyl-prolyl cis-trans isomerase
MKPRPITLFKACRSLGMFCLAVVALAVFALGLAGCSERKKDSSASQSAARVNKEEITVHQINQLLQLQRGLKPEQADAANRQILEFLVDQELAVQRTRELKIDQDPRVMLQVETAKREVLARAYAERTGESVGKPSAEDIRKYYDDKPALFKERRIYSIQELAIEAKPEQVTMLRDHLQSVKSASEFAEYLKTKNIRFTGNQGVRAAEQLPADVLENLAKMKDSQMVLLPSPTGALVIMLVSSRFEPADEARAAPAIEQFLLNDAKRKRIEADMKALRSAAKIEYIGKFAEVAASAPISGQTPPSVAAPAASGMSADDIRKGMGIKK